MDKILSIDPGNELSAYVIYDGFHILEKDKVDNFMLLDFIRNRKDRFNLVAVEMVASYGMPVGKDVFETCLWIGRFIEATQNENKIPWVPIYRKDVKLWHCGKVVGVRDSNIRRALIDKYGKKGTKKHGFNPVYNDEHVKMSEDIWSAFAIAAYLFEYSKQYNKRPFDKFEWNLQ